MGGQKKRLVYTHLISSNLILLWPLDLLFAFNTIVKGDLETRTHPPSFHEFRMSARSFFNLVHLFLLLFLI